MEFPLLWSNLGSSWFFMTRTLPLSMLAFLWHSNLGWNDSSLRCSRSPVAAIVPGRRGSWGLTLWATQPGQHLRVGCTRSTQLRVPSEWLPLQWHSHGGTLASQRWQRLRLSSAHVYMLFCSLAQNAAWKWRRCVFWNTNFSKGPSPWAYFEHGYTEAHTHITRIKDLQTTLSTWYFPLCDTMLCYVFRSSKTNKHESWPTVSISWCTKERHLAVWQNALD